MRTHNICLYKKVNKMYTGCNLKTTEFHECALIGVCAVIRSNTVCCEYSLQVLGNALLMNTPNIWFNEDQENYISPYKCMW